MNLMLTTCIKAERSVGNANYPHITYNVVQPSHSLSFTYVPRLVVTQTIHALSSAPSIRMSPRFPYRAGVGRCTFTHFVPHKQGT